MVNLVETVVNSMNSLGVKRSYGDPVAVGGVEVVPVSLVYFGFGAGSEEGGTAGGGGGGGASIPVGVYVPGPNGPYFEPNLIALLAVSIPLTWVTGRAFATVIRALKK